MPLNNDVLSRLDRGLNPTFIFEENNLTALPYQIELLECVADTWLVLASRRAGKSTTVAALAAHTALSLPDQSILVCLPTEAQAEIIIRMAKNLIVGAGLGSECKPFRKLLIEGKNSSRIEGLSTHNPNNLRSRGATMLIFDESQNISDEAANVVLPMISNVDRPKLICIGTPGPKRWFYRLWKDESEEARRIKLPATKIPFINQKTLDRQKSIMTNNAFEAEFNVNWDSAEGSVFSTEILNQTFKSCGRLFADS
ncbi:terminase large subunit domain-containing protein [Hyphococcus sp.]|uniref:terminase large subunit domain-containing protein n=1 Tax=Hyphococcus sp. TaxID=2038636 RepID=UPI003CCB76A0